MIHFEMCSLGMNPSMRRLLRGAYRLLVTIYSRSSIRLCGLQFAFVVVVVAVSSSRLFDPSVV